MRTVARKYPIPLTLFVIGAFAPLVFWQWGLPLFRGVVTLCIAWLAALILSLPRRNDLVRSLRGEDADERTKLIDLGAAAAAAGVMFFMLLWNTLVEVSRGGEGDPYIHVALAGLTTFLLLAIRKRLRS